MIFKLKNPIKNYAWGSKSALKTYFGIETNDQICAEVWMGAHPQASSQIICDSDNQEINKVLFSEIAENPVKYLGKSTAESYGKLPFLFKILSVEKTLSIQVHPNLTKAQAGFKKENDQGVDISAFNRNFKDANHKPELIYAITSFVAMNGFRPFAESAKLLSPFAHLDDNIAQFIQSPNEQTMAHMFKGLLQISDSTGQHILLSALKKYAQMQTDKVEHSLWYVFDKVSKDYPNDIGLFSLLILNIVVLQKGEAMFLDSETPHAYIEGTGLEVMANSDNVLRAGLTEKYIDIETLFDNLAFVERPLDTLKCARINLYRHVENGCLLRNIDTFATAIADFDLKIIDLDSRLIAGSNHAGVNFIDLDKNLQKTTVYLPYMATNNIDNPLILLCIEGVVYIHADTAKVLNHDKMEKNVPTSLTLNKGESCFVCGNVENLRLLGSGTLACVSNKTPEDLS